MRFSTTYICYSIMTSIIFCILSCIAEETQSNFLLIAKVYGVPIYQHQISFNPKKNEILVTEREVENLDVHIKKIIESHVIKRLGIHVKKDYVGKTVDSKFAQAGINKKQARGILKMYSALIKALEQWHQNDTQSRNIYIKELKNYMTYAQWNIWQKSYPPSKSLTKLKALIPRSLYDMKKNTLYSTEQDLLHDKLIKHITADVYVNEEDVRILYANKYKNETDKPALAKVNDKLRAEILERKKEIKLKVWWQVHFKDANIHIKNEHLKELWEKKYKAKI